ncbi:hypothetical protein [Pseudomonas wenzhouensis]|uniref:hypothetical protein n=1 Tax=Pseudomonas wenzhouensis TaxID=2906062 RepID=UPI001E4DC8B9|nr:hypothetical protein [Pseudomonas wenzhouensis]UFQ99117.1 hypothetical protein J7655_08040 [Pseudomonas wenzhouensis]
MGGRISVESVVRCSWNGWPDDRGIRTQLKEPLYNAAVKGHIESVSKLINQAGDAVCGISQLMQEDQLRKESGTGDDFLNEFSTGCLLSALQLISYSLWERSAHG